MGFPTSVSKTSPTSSDNPSAGAAQIRNLKLFLEDLFGVQDATNYSAAAFALGTAGQVTVSQPRLLFQNGDSTTPSFAFAGGTGMGMSYDTTTRSAAVLRHGTRLGYQGGVPWTLHGLTLSNNAIDPTNDIDIAVGDCSSDDALAQDRIHLALASGLTKRLDATWAVGTGAGMLASGSAIANTTYHLFLIYRPDTGVVDVAADSSATGANLATTTDAAYTKKRRLGSILRESAVLVPFVQNADWFLRSTPILDLTEANPGIIAVLRTLKVPLGLKVVSIVSVSLNGHATLSSRCLLTDPAQADADPGALGGHVLVPVGATATGESVAFVRTNTSAQVRSRVQASDANVILYLTTHGWIDERSS